jgi:predicted phage terminase large subunit-like protein
MTNAKKKISSIKAIFEQNALFRALFPELLPAGDKPWSSECLTVNRSIAAPEGTFEPAGTGTAVTSRHYDVVIEDDTVAPDFDAMSGEIQQPTKAEVEKAIGWHKLCHPLLLHPLKSQIVIIGTRWAPDDLLGWIFKHSPGYTVLSRCALELPGKVGVPASKSSGGRPIWDRFNDEALSELEASVGPLMFSTLYLNSPTAGLSMVFRRENIQYYESLPRDLVYCTSVDPAPTDSSTTTDSDYSVVLTTACDPATSEVFVVHYDRKRVDPGELIELIFNHNRAYKPMLVKIESVAYQRTLCYWVRRRQEQLGERFYVDEVKNAKTSKSARILGLQPWFAAGRVSIRVEHSDLERELLSFNPERKYAGHDDCIDALSMHVKFWSDAIADYRAATETEVEVDAFSGAALLSELKARVVETKRYPYDIGNMAERISPLREYTYN